MVRENKILLVTTILLVFSFLFSINFISAGHIVNATGAGITFYVLEDVPFKFNITVNNTDFGATGTASNITRVNVTLPSSFSFNPPTNRTSVNASFSNISNVLSWLNSTPYLINATNLFVYFEFNATALTPGTYNLSVRTLNATETYYFETNLTVVVNDTNAPVVTLNTPTNAISSTDTQYNFTFNVTDDRAANCTLFVNNVKIENSTSINITGGLSGIMGYSFSLGTHIWFINCTDSANNQGNSSTRTFIVTAPATTATSSGGDGGTAPEYISTKIITQAEFEAGVEKQLKTNERVKLNVIGMAGASETHYVGIKELTETNAKIKVSSTPQTAVLSIGEEKKFDVTNDGSYDISVKLNSIVSNKASLTIKSINEKIAVETPITSTPSAEEITSPITEEPVIETLDETKGVSLGLWITIAIIAVAIIIAIIYYFMNPKTKKKNFYVVYNRKKKNSKI